MKCEVVYGDSNFCRICLVILIFTNFCLADKSNSFFNNGNAMPIQTHTISLRHFEGKLSFSKKLLASIMHRVTEWAVWPCGNNLQILCLISPP